jgi:hypothetical protein
MWWEKVKRREENEELKLIREMGTCNPLSPAIEEWAISKTELAGERGVDGGTHFRDEPSLRIG